MKEIKVIEVKEITAKNGNKFKAYKTVGKGGRKMDLRFVKDCKNIPTEPCFIHVEEDNANVDTSREYPIVWVKNVEAIVPFDHKGSNLDEYI